MLADFPINIACNKLNEMKSGETVIKNLFVKILIKKIQQCPTEELQ